MPQIKAWVVRFEEITGEPPASVVFTTKEEALKHAVEAVQDIVTDELEAVEWEEGDELAAAMEAVIEAAEKGNFEEAWAIYEADVRGDLLNNVTNIEIEEA
jgi:hypothetical protein